MSEQLREQKVIDPKTGKARTFKVRDITDEVIRERMKRRGQPAPAKEQPPKNKG